MFNANPRTSMIAAKLKALRGRVLQRNATLLDIAARGRERHRQAHAAKANSQNTESGFDDALDEPRAHIYEACEATYARMHVWNPGRRHPYYE